MSNVRACLVCHHENPIHAARCERCGAPLRVGKTMRISEKQDQNVGGGHVDPSIRLPIGTIAVYLVGRGEPLMIDASDDVFIGRHTPGEPAPEIDLTQYHGGLLGVSRKHAVIRRHHRGYVIQDLNSTNGTWVNNTQLEPEQEAPLYSGDQVRLGQLVMFVHYAS